MLLAEIVKTSIQVTATRSRLEKVRLLASCLKQLGEKDINMGVSLLSGRIPQGRIGIGPALIQDVASGLGPREPSLTLSEVEETFNRIMDIRGSGSVEKRRALLRALLDKATPEERDFLIRLILGELRQGALEGIMIEALAKASGIPTTEIRKAVMLAGDIAPVAGALLSEGSSGLGRFSLTLFLPLKPMLAETAHDLTEVLGQLGKVAFEYKMDGVRIQVHKEGSRVRVFTRRLHDITPAVPEIVEVIGALTVRSIILDGEALALKPDGTPHPFQITMRRLGRRLDVEQMRRELPLTPFFFDCLYLDGQDLIDKPTGDRFSALQSVLPERLWIPRLVTEDPEEADEFLNQALREGHEGIMAKDLNSLYEAGSRGRSWLKIKPAHTLDMVVLAAEWGHGRREGLLSNLHLGVKDPRGGGFVMLGKTFKGMTDEMLAWQTKRLLELEIARDDYTVYVRPELVVEVAFNDIQLSPHYPGGVALRFARIKRYRPDKGVEEINTLEEVKALLRQK